MHPTLFSFGNFHVYSYGFMVAFGFLSGIFLAYFLAKRVNIVPDKVFDVSLFVLLGAIIGARLFYVILYYQELKTPWDAFMIWQGGLVFYGGLLFAVLGLIGACKIFKISVLDMLDVAAPATALGYAFGRIGCFLNGCCYGDICSLPWAVHFPSLEGLRHPTQIYSSVAGLVIFAALLLMFYRRKFPGQIFASGVLFYGIYRFLIEFFRTNPKIFLNLTSAQWASVFLTILGIALYIIYNKFNKH